jgi:hypothetical protein
MNRNTTVGHICSHNGLSQSAPCEMESCSCGKNQRCLVCGFGFASFPCDCSRITPITITPQEIKSVAEIICLNFIDCDSTAGCGRCNELRNFVDKVLTPEEIKELKENVE